MKRPRLSAEGIKTTKAWEYALRFAFGGVISVVTGLIGKKLGPDLGGMLMAFPAILPATLTLVKRHDGRKQAELDARGGRIGTVALAAFACAVVGTAGRLASPVVLAVAACAWIAVAVGGWFVIYGRGRD